MGKLHSSQSAKVGGLSHGVCWAPGHRPASTHFFNLSTLHFIYIQGIASSGALHNPQYITASKVFQVINHNPNTYYSHAWCFCLTLNSPICIMVALMKLLSIISITIHQASLSFRRELLDDLPIEMPRSGLLGEFPAMFEYQTVVVKSKTQCQLYIIIYQIS